MTTTEYLERRAFNAGYVRGRYQALGPQFDPVSGEQHRDHAWEEYRSQPVQLELPLEAPNDQADRL